VGGEDVRDFPVSEETESVRSEDNSKSAIISPVGGGKVREDMVMGTNCFCFFCALFAN